MKKSLRPGERDPEGEAFALRLMARAAALGGELDADTAKECRWRLDNETTPFREKLKTFGAALREAGYGDKKVALACGFAWGMYRASDQQQCGRNDSWYFFDALRVLTGGLK